MLALIAVILLVVLFMPTYAGTSPKSATEEAESSTLVTVGHEAPGFAVEMLNGQQITLSSLRGKVVLLNFWATWCPPCRQELARVQTDLIDRFAGRDFVFLPLSRGEERSAVTAFLKKTGYTFPVGLDSARTVYDLYATNYIPRNFLIGKDGKVIASTIGYDAKEFEALIEQIETTLAQ